jgi:hypothetical protein
VLFEGSGVASIGQVKAKCDGLSVLVSRIESVAQMCRHRQFLMYELENCDRWRRLAAVT